MPPPSEQAHPSAAARRDEDAVAAISADFGSVAVLVPSENGVAS